MISAEKPEFWYFTSMREAFLVDSADGSNLDRASTKRIANNGGLCE